MTTTTRPLITEGMFTSRTDEWSTPVDFWRRLDAEFHFELDPASTHENALCVRHYTEAENGLAQSWHPFGPVWLNPPFGRTLGLWVEKAYRESERGATVVALLPARPDTRWFHAWCWSAAEIRLVKGRLKFGGAANSAPFPTMVVVWAPGPRLLTGPVFSAMDAR
jgi:site-specific DNA-methyltransferase (adenine-specific)